VIDHRKLFQNPRDQGNCGSCWAFSTAAAVEAHIKKSGGSNEYLSTQQLINCNTDANGCNGGTFPAALNYIKTKGLVKDAKLGYTGKKDNCNDGLVASADTKIDSWEFCDGDCTEDKIIGFLQRGPVLIGVDGENNTFRLYDGGIYTASCTGKLNHAVVLVGSGKDFDTNKEYWLVRNSWGSNDPKIWGEKGYIKIERNAGNNKSCFVTQLAYLPIISGGSSSNATPSTSTPSSGAGAGANANAAGAGANASANLPPGKKFKKTKKKIIKKRKAKKRRLSKTRKTKK